MRIGLELEDRDLAPFYKIMDHAGQSDDHYLTVVHRTLDVLRARDFVPRGLAPHEGLDQHLTYVSDVRLWQRASGAGRKDAS